MDTTLMSLRVTVYDGLSEALTFHSLHRYQLAIHARTTFTAPTAVRLHRERVVLLYHAKRRKKRLERVATSRAARPIATRSRRQGDYTSRWVNDLLLQRTTP
jgi:hypothetical protein